MPSSSARKMSGRRATRKGRPRHGGARHFHARRAATCWGRTACCAKSATSCIGCKQQHSLTYARMLANRGRVQMKLGKPGRGTGVLRRGARAAAGPAGAARSGSGSAAGGQVELPSCGRTISSQPSATRARRWISTPLSLPQLHPDRTQAQAQLGETLRLQGRLDEASVTAQGSSESPTARCTAMNDRRVADVLDSLAKIRRGQHDLSDAEKYAQQAVDVADQGGWS